MTPPDSGDSPRDPASEPERSPEPAPEREPTHGTDAAPAAPAVRRYARADGAAVTFEAALCEHAGECVRGLPAVFDTAKRPWIQPEHASRDELETVISRCPSLALKFERVPLD